MYNENLDNKISVFRRLSPDVFMLSAIYDPDKHGASPAAQGKIVPSPGSLVVDDTIGEHNRLYVVQSVNETTYASTLVPALTTMVGDSTDTLLDRSYPYHLYYQPLITTNEHGESEELRQLVVDSKLTVIGSASWAYQLSKELPTGERVPISLFTGSTDEFRTPPETTLDSSLCPVILGQHDYLECQPCVTRYQMTNRERVYLTFFNNKLMQIAEFTLESLRVSKPITEESHVVTKFIISCNQYDDDGNFILYQGQNPADLVFTGRLIFNDGHESEVSFGDGRGFIYNLPTADDYRQLVPGEVRLITFKYYLPRALPADLQQENATVGYSYNVAWVATTERLLIRSYVELNLSKCSFIPYVSGAGWGYEIYGYRQDFQEPFNMLTDYGDKFQLADFDGTSTAAQNLTMTLTENDQEVYRQRLLLKLGLTEGTVPFILNDLKSDSYSYGVDGGGYHQPIIYVAPSGHTMQSKFPRYTEGRTVNFSGLPGDDYQQLKELQIFLTNYYYNANPPTDPTSKLVSRPTHWRLKLTRYGAAVAGLTAPFVLADYRELSDYNQPVIWSMPGDSQTPSLRGTTLILEWAISEGGRYRLLYGVPVTIVYHAAGLPNS